MIVSCVVSFFFFFQAEDGIRDPLVTGVQTCALPIFDPVAGHIPGARNHPFAGNLDAHGRFLAAPELRRRWAGTLRERAPQTLIAMCGSGVTACHNLLALEAAGLPGARLYAGSWSEWIRDPARPVARGGETS